MDTWHVTVTLDQPMPDTDTLHELVDALPRGAGAGRLPSSDRLRVNVRIHADSPASATGLATAIVSSTLFEIGQHDPDSGVLSVRVERDDEHQRRADAVDDIGIPPIYATAQAADLLGITTGALRQRAEAGSIPARKIGERSWVFPAAAIDALAATKADGRPSRPNGLHAGRNASARLSE